MTQEPYNSVKFPAYEGPGEVVPVPNGPRRIGYLVVQESIAVDDDDEVIIKSIN